MTVIEGPRYERSRALLREDPIVLEMAVDLAYVPIEGLAHVEDGHKPTPKFNFMTGANMEYRARGGKVEGLHIGAVAEVLLEMKTAASSAD